MEKQYAAGKSFYKDEDFRDIVIVNGKHVMLSYEGSSKVRCVFVDFLGEIPSSWKKCLLEDNEKDNWINLDVKEVKLMTEELVNAILHHKVRGFVFSLEPWGEGHYLTADFANGWAALVYDDADEQIYYSPYNADYDTVEILAPVEIGGQSPVPKMFALDTMELVAKIASYFLETGQLCPDTMWTYENEA